MPEPTRDRLIRTAHDLFYRQGFHSVGVDQILAEVGVTKTTFYNHFRSKEELVLEVLRWHDHWWRDTFRRLLRKHGGDRPRDQLVSAFDALRDVFEAGDYNGCFFINVAVQFPGHHEEPHRAAAEHKAAMEDILRELAGYAGAADPAVLARQLALVLEGAYVTLQVSGDPEVTATARDLAALLVARQVDAPAAANA